MFSSQKGFNFFAHLSPFLRIPIFSSSQGKKRSAKSLHCDPFFSTSYLWESVWSDVECPLLGTCALRSHIAQRAPPAAGRHQHSHVQIPHSHALECPVPSQAVAMPVALGCSISISAYFWNFPSESKSGGAHGHQQWQHRTALTLMLAMLLLFYASF